MIKKVLNELNKPKVLLSVSLIVLVILVIIGVFFLTRNSNPLPENIKSKLTFSPLVIPSYVDKYPTAEYKVTTAEDEVQTLSYVIKLKNGSVSISEQLQPPEFAEIPEYKDRFLNNVAKQYGTVQTSNGIIYLGRLARNDNQQLGIMLERGLLIFINPDKGTELSETEWRGIGDNFEIQKINN